MEWCERCVRIFEIIGWSPDRTENESLARVWLLDAAYFRRLDKERQREFMPAVMVDKMPDAPRLWVLSPEAGQAGSGERMM